MPFLVTLLNRFKSLFFSNFKPLQPSTPFPRLLVCSLLFLVVCKLLLTSQEEIGAFCLPHDDLWQVKAAARAYWGGAYNASKLYHLPVFPLFMEIVRIFGIPLRVALEIFYCGAAYLLVSVLWRLGTPIGLTIIAATALIFHPASYQLPNRCGAEILLTPLMMGAIAASLFWWLVRDRPDSFKYAAFAGVWWALAWNVRKESIVIIPIFAVMFLFAVVSDRRGAWLKSVAAIALMLCCCLAMETTIKTANWARWGLFATSVHTAPGFKSAIKALQSIRPETPLAFIPVPSEVRQRAYEVSPSFSKLEPSLEGDVARGWMVHSKPFTDSKNVTGLSETDISAGWFYWAFYDAVIAAGYGKDPGEADRFLAKIGEEIQAALSDGRLPKRWVPMAMLDPSLSLWLPRFPESLARVGGIFFKPAVPARPVYDSAFEDACGPAFDRGANRRSHLISSGSEKAGIVGWSFASGDTVQSVEVVSSSGTLLGRSSLNLSRPDVDTSRSVGFQLPLIVPSKAEWSGAVVGLALESGKIIRKPLAEIPLAQVISIPVGESTVYLAVDNIHPPVFKANLLRDLQVRLESCYLTLLYWLFWPGLVMALVIVIISALRSRPIDIAIAILVVAVLSRYLFFSILDASAWPGDQPRYLYPAYPLFSLALLLVYSRFLSLISFVRRGSSS